MAFNPSRDVVRIHLQSADILRDVELRAEVCMNRYITDSVFVDVRTFVGNNVEKSCRR